jgi:deoxyuridine 5'-triphosphate nucleotidohydrolase
MYNTKDVDPNMQFLPKLKFEKTHDLAKLPTKNHESDTGYDVYSIEDKVIPARGSAVVSVGLKFASIPDGYWVKVESRSGLGFKHGIMAHPGIIDCGYRGDAGVKLYNLTDNEYQVKSGDRIAQFAIYLNFSMPVEWGNVEESTRGDKGFGSSGK